MYVAVENRVLLFSYKEQLSSLDCVWFLVNFSSNVSVISVSPKGGSRKLPAAESCVAPRKGTPVEICYYDDPKSLFAEIIKICIVCTKYI
jgi:hypothetical protein